MTSRADFGETTTGSEVAKTFGDQIRGKTILVTGVGPNGIGATTVLAFASQAPKLLILASRTKAKLDAVAQDVHEQYPGVRVEVVLLDLASQGSVRAAAAEVSQLTDRLDILVNNAALVIFTRQATAEGIEMQFGVNHIGPFLFTNLLLPLLRNAAKTNPPGATRIVSLTSAGHRLSPIRFSDYNLKSDNVPPEEDHVKPLAGAFGRTTEDGYNGIVAYGQSKTANILFTLYLQEHLSKQGISSYTLHPGSIETDLSRDNDEEMAATFAKVVKFWKTPDQGASTTLVAATDPALNEIKGLYLNDCQFIEPTPHAKVSLSADRLWKLSEELVGEKFDLDAQS
ncbi:hypothetical protein B0T16DRAFT_436190 [Cercophora newfieldiana]|uniref:NAD(P)-binding protein n=1 Tax=Cercophora newfieldiana TaxID=92897 RepID=A0AA39YAT6_9PEZI|nr:hypothetical protein B0T16DRAFT_436190 [Cercophora newfieldiana]